MKKLFVILLCSVSQVSFSAFEHLQYGGRSAALGNSLVAMRGNEWSVFSNPALLSTISSRTLALSYVPQPYDLKELGRAALSYVEPSGIGSFCVSASRFGFSLYNETSASLSFASRIADLIIGGITARYYALSITHYGTASTFGIDIGFLLDLSDNVHWGFAAFNINAPTIGLSKEKLPQIFSTGIAFHPTVDAMLTANILKDVRYSVEFRFGVEYTLVDIIALRAGTTSDPNTLNAGIGVSYLFANVDYAFSSHPELGMSHQISLSLRLSDL